MSTSTAAGNAYRQPWKYCRRNVPIVCNSLKNPPHLQPTLFFWILLIHDSLLLCSFLLLSTGLSGFLSLHVSQFKEVLLHTGPVLISFLLTLFK